ncbi:MAG: HAD family hydrolase [Brachybacterium tyrofermentans]
MPLAIFDLDGTLVDQAAAARDWARGFAQAWSLDERDAVVIAAASAQRRPKGEIFSMIVQCFSLPMTPEAAWSDYRAHMPDLVRCSDTDRSALRALRNAGWRLGIVTNGMVDNQEGKIRSTGLADLVDGWVISSEFGERKPEPSIFHELARRLECPLDGWMVGDSLETDVAGGLAVGLETAWITSAPATDPRPAPTVSAPTVKDAVDKILTGQR